jgi:type I restriction enzyme M protein
MPEAQFLHCPIRGQLRVAQRAADGLTFTEEKNRIDALRYLIQRQYPKENFGVETTLFRLGNKGRNSFRTDFAVYDTAYDDVRGMALDKRLDHLRLLAEIKRENSDAESAKANQVRPAMTLVPYVGTLGVYWDDVEQRFFYRQIEHGHQTIHEAPISKIPTWGLPVGSTQLRYADLDPARDLVKIFNEIEDALHVYVVDKQARYEVIQQLLLTKIHDENLHLGRATVALDFQDFSVEAVSDSVVAQRMTAALKRAAGHYNQYLPKDKRISDRFSCPSAAMREVTRILAPVNILGSKVQVIQSFYMKFAKDIYKWDLAQYFTPHEVIDFIVSVVNPTSGEHVKDPACGSADFLISAFRHTGRASHDSVWGSDNDPKAVQISVLNMVLNGDGKTQILQEDSLEAYGAKQRNFSVVLCNPPFGTKIVEKRYEVLRKFDMGYRWQVGHNGRLVRTDEVLPKQQTGILFAELCVRLAEPRGRVGIILPNGYLGNTRAEYLALREWLLCHTRLVGIVSFPRFTFKKSGADVSASAVFLERRETPLIRSSDSEGYPFHVGMVESVGWWAGDKNARPIYRQDPATGDFLLDYANEPIIDADFPDILQDFLTSPAADAFPWLTADRDVGGAAHGRAFDIRDVTALPDVCLDPKRYSSKYIDIRHAILEGEHFRLADVVEIVPSTFRPGKSDIYRYVEIENAGRGEYDYATLRGWELPNRAKLRAQPGDIFVAHIWGSVEKWFMAAGDCSNLVATNGFTRLRVKSDQKHRLPDLVAGLCSEAYRVQMRALARGSDGLAAVMEPDLLTVVLPVVAPDESRSRLMTYVESLYHGEDKLSKAVGAVMETVLDYPIPQERKSHCSLV